MDYIILCQPRTGSNLLRQLLRKHWDIDSFFSEPLTKLIDRENYIKTVEIKIGHKSNIQYNLSDLDNIDIYFNVLNSLKQRPIVGCKIFFHHLERNIDNFNLINFIQKNNTKIILLERTNKFLQFLSNEKAIKSRVFYLDHHGITNPRPENIKIHININKYYEYMDKFTKDYINQEKQFKEYNIPYIKIYYEDLISESQLSIMKDIYKLLLSSLDETKIKQKPSKLSLVQNIYTLEEQIQNYSEVLYQLKDDPHFMAALEQDRCKSPYGSS
jgi:LPS sulfotransferase NodH